MNRSKDLRSLFRQTLINKARIKTTPTYGGNTNINPMYMKGIHRIPGQYENGILFNNEVKIFFYEWSDVNRSPRCFYQLDAFDNFLKTSGIFMELYQREIIKNLGCVYVSCYRNTKRLALRASYKNLVDCMNEHDKSMLIPSVSNSNIHPPRIILETENRLPQNDGTFFG